QKLSARRKDHRDIGVGWETPDLAGRGHMKETRFGMRKSDSQGFAIRRKSHGPGPVLVVAQAADTFAGCRVPEFRILVLSAANHSFAIGGEGDAVDLVFPGILTELPDWLCFFQIP